MNLQAHQKHEWSNNLSNTNGVTKSPTVPSGSQGAVAQLDDTGRGMSRNIHHPEGCLWKNNIKADKKFLGFVELVFAFSLMGKHTLSDWQLAHTPFTLDGVWVKECWCVKCRCTIRDFTNFLSTYFGEGIPANLKNVCPCPWTTDNQTGNSSCVKCCRTIHNFTKIFQEGKISRRRNFEKERLQEGESHIKISQKTREKSRVQESRVQDFFLQSPVKCKT